MTAVTGGEIAARVRGGGLFLTAVTHPSYAHERGAPDNQRLEFLGDAVLQLVVSDLLFRRFPALEEAELTRFRAALVRQEALARRGRALGLGRLLRLGQGEQAQSLRDQDSTLCDTFEAVVAALYLEDGLEAARAFIAAEMEAEMAELGEAPWRADPKSVLLYALQAAGRHPAYRVVGREGPDHRPMFEVAVYDGERELGRGRGASKRAAEEAAAHAALEADPALAARGAKVERS
ncbi:MAG: ribonuclease III [Firmicutes bacterium]|nr:ribonuclease III [Bacillota bacterium]